MNRSLRRHNEERVKAKFHRKNKLHPYWGDGEKSAGMFAHHGCTCSCHMCGNPRKHFGELTMQERRFQANTGE